jgi:hypothetical protein
MMVRGGGRGGGGDEKAAPQVSGELFQNCVDAIAQRWGKPTSGEGAGPAGCPAEWVDKVEEFLAEEKSYSHYIHHFRNWFELYGGKDGFLFIADTTLHDQARVRLLVVCWVLIVGVVGVLILLLLLLLLLSS